MTGGENEEGLERISIEKAMEILNNGGLTVTREQAQMIVDFLYKLAEISLSNIAGKRS